MKTVWVIKLEDDSLATVIANHRPKAAITVAPKENGDYVTDIDWIDVLDVDVDGITVKQAIVNPTKKADKLAALQAKEDAKAADRAAKQAKVDKLKGKKKNDLKNDNDIKQAIEDILDYLGLG